MKICMECKWHEQRGIVGNGTMLTDHCVVLGGMQDCVTGGTIIGERCRVMRLAGPCGPKGELWEPKSKPKKKAVETFVPLT